MTTKEGESVSPFIKNRDGDLKTNEYLKETDNIIIKRLIMEINNKELVAQEDGIKKWNRLWVLQMSLRGDVAHFCEYAVRAKALESEYDAKQADEYLKAIEDSILRYREGRPQSFEEEKE